MGPLLLVLLVTQTSGQTFLSTIIDRLGLPTIPDTATFLPRYDFVVVGAGSAGCLLANRLSENPAWTVLLVEAGREESMLTDVPLLVSYILGTSYDWGYKTEPQEGVCLGMNGGKCSWPRGKALGGTSVLNYMVYTRGFAADYDNWARLGNKGWESDKVLPYFLKYENVKVPDARGSWYGRGGLLDVERPSWRTPLAKAFVESGRSMGYPTDREGFTPHGFSYVMSTTRRGARLSASKAFLRPVRDRLNLMVARQAYVTKLILKNGRAVGVELVKGGRTHRVAAAKEVILSAGSFNSPQLLMLSGVGPGDHLRELGIPVVQNLPVGENLQDHVSMAGLAFFINESLSIVEDRYRTARHTMDYLLRGRGPYTLPGGAEALAFISTSGNDNTSHPDLELVFGPGAFTGDSGGSLRRGFNFNETFFKRTYGPLFGREAFSIVPVLLRPKSRGYLRLRSRNPYHAPLLYSNYYRDDEDLRRMVDGLKKAVSVGESDLFRRWGSRVMRRPVEGCTQPWGTDQYWRCVARHMTTNLHHQVGTCKMGPDGDQTAVVDPRLRVRGLTGLRVVDASIMPVIPAAHTNAVVFMIAEKAADMIKADYNYTKPT